MEVNCEEFKHIITTLIKALKTRLQPLLENNVFKAISSILDSESYKFLDGDVIHDKAKVIVEHFKDFFSPIIVRIDHSKEYLEILFDRIKRYISNLLQKNAGQLFFAMMTIWEFVACYLF